MASKGDELLLSKLEKLHYSFNEYSSEATKLTRQISFVLDRLRAVVYPNPINNIKAISRPDPQTISESIANIVKNMVFLFTGLQTLSLELINECCQGRVQCESCGGAGFIKEKVVVRDEEFIGEDYHERKCDYCDGHGVLEITRAFSVQAQTMLRNLKDLYSKDTYSSKHF